MRIVGVFQPNNPDEEYWFIRPDFLKERLIVTEEIFDQQVSPLLSDEIYTAFWSILMDGSEVRPDQAMTLVRRINNFQKECNERLPRIKLPVSPVDSLYSYQSAANLLTVLLFAFSVPIFGLLLAFITMTSGMTVERQRNEIAILRSRGAMLVQMIGISIVECLLLSVVALLIAIPLSAGIAWAIGRTRSFLDFSAASGPNLIWDPATIRFAVRAILLTCSRACCHHPRARVLYRHLQTTERPNPAHAILEAHVAGRAAHDPRGYGLTRYNSPADRCLGDG